MAKKPTKAQLEKEQAKIEAEQAKLEDEKQALTREIIKPKKEVPLHQLNLMAKYGAKKAKEILADKWV